MSESVPTLNGAAMYVSIAYRWGYLNGHQYFVYVGSDKAKATALAHAENSDRGGKYGCAVIEFKDEDAGEQRSSNVAYFASSYGETKPFHNYRIDMFQNLGHKFHHYAEGTVYLPEDSDTIKDREGKPARVLKPHKMEPPQWVLDAVKHEQEMCDILSGSTTNGDYTE